MNTAQLIETCLPAIIPALTAREKWGSATSGLNSSDAAIPTWFLISAGITLGVLIASSIIVTYKQKAKKK